MLCEEEIPPIEHRFDKHMTSILEEEDKIKGFFTINGHLKHGHIALIHFCTNSKFRTPALARQLTKELIKKVKSLKAKKFIINCPVEKKYLQRVIKYYFKKDPYADKSRHNFTLVEV
jgi:hypothetical protein|tara:strand:- start:10 stop:360 length:351 start_codon:yes stop_codon:yes gene_type:complete